MSAVAAPGVLVTPSLELKRRIGEGGMGTVWIAYHRGLRKEVAVKLMAESILSSEELRVRFEQEAVAGANVKSPHVVQIFDTGATPELGPYIVMELLEGEDLGSRLARKTVLAPADAVRVVTQAAHALDRAHAIGIVHRDIKPANLFLCDDQGDASSPFLTKILDFGVAVLRAEASPRTAVGISIGTPSYMSPEQAAAKQDLDGTSDLYALGLVAFRALTGTVAFPRESLEALGLGVYNLPPPKLTERRASLPEAVDAWFARACARDRAARFPDGATMATELARALGLSVADGPRDAKARPADSEPPRSDGPTRTSKPEGPPDAVAPIATTVPARASKTGSGPKPEPEPEASAARVERPEPTANTDVGLTQRTVPGQEAPRARSKARAAGVVAGVIAIVAGVGWTLRSASIAEGPVTGASAPVSSAPSTSAAPSASAAPIPIGVLLDLSGERRKNGQKLLAATVAAQDLVNRAGGIRGRPIRLVVKDDQGDTGAFLAESARALFREEGLKIVLGPVTSPQVAVVAPLAQAAGILEISGTATSAHLTILQRPADRLLFRTVPSQATQASALARVMRGARVAAFPDASAHAPAAGAHAPDARALAPDARSLRCDAAAIVATDDVTGRPFAEEFKRSFSTNGGRVVETRFVAAEDQASYAEEIRAVVASRADCQVLALGPKAAARYLREALTDLDPGAKLPPTFGINNLALSDFVAYARNNPHDPTSASVADGVRGVRPATRQPWRPEYLELEYLLASSDAGVDRSDASVDLSASPFVANQFDAAILAALALESAGPDAEPAHLRKALRDIARGGHLYGPQELKELLAAIRRGEQVDYVGASGDVDIDENGDVDGDLVTWVVRGGEIVETGRLHSDPQRHP